MKYNSSVNKILAILDLISKHDEGLTLSQIYRILDIKKATCYDFLRTLYYHDAIYYKDPFRKNYVIGSKMFAIGSVYIHNSNFVDATNYYIGDLANKYQKTVVASKQINEKIVYVNKVEPLVAIVNSKIEIGLIENYSKDNPIHKKFMEALDSIGINFTTSYGVHHINSQLGILTIPIYNFENRVCGVISTIGLASEAPSNEERRDLISAAINISKRLGLVI
ncbi:MAG: helix-turn-helix domain-containing protein [Acholeplasmatales bacterium]|jgi:DNA-binding IclR family transcriptional regulator|nr:helix-turn-helix domain-containing protein [Acholeplasmatales bacterium]